ncbi:MAG: DMT family transporter [Casimicrobiaceae bacterium]
MKGAAPGLPATPAALAAIALWGTLAWLSLVLAAWPPFFLLGSALAIGALPALYRIRDWRVPARTLVLGVYGLFGFHFFLFLALRHAPPVEANLINYLWPLLIVLLAPVLLQGYQLRGRHVGGALMGFAGAMLLIGPDVREHTFAIGYVYALASAFIWSSYSLWTKRVPAFSTAAIGLFCAVASGLAFVAHGLLEPRFVPPRGDLPYLLAMGLGPMGAAFFLWDRAMKRGDPRHIGALAYLTPVLSTLLLIAAGRGALSLRIALATALVIGGASMAARSR